MIRRDCFFPCLAVLLVHAAPGLVSGAEAKPLEPGVIEFSIVHEAKPDHGVVVSGAADALGNGNPLRAIRLAPGTGNRWSARVALPAGAKISYRFFERDFRASAWGNQENFTPLGGAGEIMVPGPAPLERPRRVILWSDWKQAWIRFRTTAVDAPWRELEMKAEQRGGTAVFVAAQGLPASGEIEFVFHDGGGRWLNAPPPPRAQARGAAPEVPLPYQKDLPPWNFRCSLPSIHVRHGQIHAGEPPETSLAPRMESLPIPARGKIPGRPVSVWLPRDFGVDEERTYPVVLFHDGQNVFFPGGPFGTWDADRIAGHEILHGRMTEAILVAVPNGNDYGSDRLVEYLPEGENLEYAGKAFTGHASAYVEWLIHEVIPRLEARYPIRRDPAARHLAGSSMGGLVTDFAGGAGDAPIRGSLGIFSPAYWAAPRWCGSATARAADGIPRFISMGTAESSRGESGSDTYWRGAFEALDRRAAAGAIHGKHLHFAGTPGGRHNEAAWASLLPAYFAFALPPGESCR